MNFRRCVSVQNSLDTAYWGEPCPYSIGMIHVQGRDWVIRPGEIIIWYPHGRCKQTGPVFSIRDKAAFFERWLDEADVPPGTPARAAIDVMPSYDEWEKSTWEGRA